ncbi:uncharacterized protein V1510DRAFT_424260 [Dipodascopsis tothii]|uniref:uncharacterized protein n=1 Tax=Dipodascopsis tothii TaxID=44089 RepID=UPI0034CD5D3C
MARLFAFPICVYPALLVKIDAVDAQAPSSQSCAACIELPAQIGKSRHGYHPRSKGQMVVVDRGTMAADQQISRPWRLVPGIVHPPFARPPSGLAIFSTAAQKFRLRTRHERAEQDPGSRELRLSKTAVYASHRSSRRTPACQTASDSPATPAGRAV